MTTNEMRLGSLQLVAYGLYQIDWCTDRMIDIQQFDYDHGINSENFVCFEEFKQNEFLEKDYMEFLLPEELYAQYRELVLGEVLEDA